MFHVSYLQIRLARLPVCHRAADHFKTNHQIKVTWHETEQHELDIKILKSFNIIVSLHFQTTKIF